VDDIVGIDDHGRDRTERAGYAYDYALQIAEHGMAAVAIEPMAFGCRRDPVTKSQRALRHRLPAGGGLGAAAGADHDRLARL
jgi:hypothetical protein